MSGIPSAIEKSENGSQYWEKTLTDMNNVDENFQNARDLGYLRLNYSRLSAIGQLAKFDNQDIYKIDVQSNGKMGISIRNTSGDDEKVLDLSKYDAFLDELKKQNDPEGYAKEQEEKLQKEAEQKLIEVSAPGMKMEVYMIKNGREVLLGDSSAEEGSKERETLDSMLTGEYKAQKGTYYVKLSRDDTVDQDEEIQYALQLSMGDSFKHDYAMIEQVSSDTKNKTESKVPLTTTSGQLSSANALQIQATRYQATAQMLAVGYLNMADIYSRNSSTTIGSLTVAKI